MKLTLTVDYGNNQQFTLSRDGDDDIFNVVDTLGRFLVSAGYAPETVDDAFRQYEPMVQEKQDTDTMEIPDNPVYPATWYEKQNADGIKPATCACGRIVEPGSHCPECG